MSAPEGLGWWVAFEGTAHRGGQDDDLERIVDVCRRTGATWVAPRAGAGAQPDAHFNTRSVEAFKAAGLKVYPWIFAYPRSMQAELRLYRWWASLVDGCIINAEFEFYQSATEQQACDFVAAIRACGYDFVAHAPPDYAGARGDGVFPVLDELCDAIMPQVYAWEHDDRGHAHHLNAVMKLYAARLGSSMGKVQPIGCSYRPKTRGFKDGKPIALAPLADQAERVARDAVAFVEHPWVSRCSAPSFYSADALTFINGADDRVVDALARYVAPPLPPPKWEPAEWGLRTRDQVLEELFGWSP